MWMWILLGIGAICWIVWYCGDGDWSEFLSDALSLLADIISSIE